MKKLNLSIILALIVSCFVFVSCSGAKDATKDAAKETPTLRVFAAASLKESLDTIKDEFEKKEGVKLEYNLAGSGTLANQITQADVCDVFISASKKHMQIVSDKNLASKPVDLFKNKLVLITPKENNKVKSIEDLSKVSKIALGETESVPVGKYSKESLTKLNLWDSLEKSQKIVFAKDVKSVLNYVETGEVDAGIVYLSDANSSDKVNVIATFDESTHSPIIYPAAVIDNSPQKDLAEKFLAYIKENADKFEKNGFIVIK